jgi:DNA-binding NarL/FixJ family response regulator
VHTVSIEILLGLNLISVLILIKQSSSKQAISSQQDVYQDMLQHHLKMKQELSELRGTVELCAISIQQKNEQNKLDKNAAISPVSSTNKANQVKKLSLNVRYKEIFDLHQQGLTAEQIARKLEKGYDEVSFILELASQSHA